MAGSEATASGPIIQTRDLGVRFGPRWGVRGLDLEVREGEIFGFLGRNGSGKTTTIKLLLDLLRPHTGEARVLDEPVRRGGGALRRQIGYLPGDLALFDHLSGLATLRLFEGLQQRPSGRRDEVLERLGFPLDALGRKVRHYSTGMRQALGITVALQHDPRLAILDEPTTGLDPAVREGFLELVRDLRDVERTVFLSSHVLEEIERTADRVAIVADGRLELVESIQRLRESKPRLVRARYRDGREEHRTFTGPPGPLVESIAVEGLVDLEIRAAPLEEFFRRSPGEEPQ